jgi:aldehyde dehydrogenase (NAD+)
LCLVPLIYALAAGNTAILYPSLFTKKINQVIKNIISSVFEKEYVNIVTYEECGYEEILKPNYSFIFFTGGVETGKKIMKQASEALTPICLELGGKCPCIIDQTADLDITAKRIIRGKILNSGQTCIAPDYILVQKNMEEELIKKLIKYIQEFFVSDSYEQNTKIINEFHFERIINLLKKQKILFMNGKIEKEKLFIPFALVKVDNFENILMKEEIFGPILPIISFENINDEIKNIHKLYKPLALYIFSNSKQNQEFCIKNISSGSVCINDTIMHLVNSNLPFGGVGHSGFGKYHGIEGFNLFCNIRSYLNTSNQLDSNLFYPP